MCIFLVMVLCSLFSFEEPCLEYEDYSPEYEDYYIEDDDYCSEYEQYCLEDQKLSEDQLVVLSVPRSGSTWLLYILGYLTKKKVFFVENESEKLMFLSQNLESDSPETPDSHILRYHNPDFIKDTEGHLPLVDTKLVCIVRDYRETFGRRFKRDKSTEEMPNPKFSECIQKQFYLLDQYLGILYFYDYWMGKDKLLIYYEDLIENPQKELIRLCDFLGIDKKMADSFLLEYDYHVENSLNIYDLTTGKETIFGGSKSRGKDLHYHSKNFDLKDLKQFDRFMRRTYPRIYKKYLMNYKLN